MKAFVEVQQITLQVHEHEMTFSEGELKFILEEYFDSKVKNAEGGTERQEKGAAEEVKTKFEFAKKPIEEEPFEVNPSEIDRKLFSAHKEDRLKEGLRQLILEAFAKVDENPERYAKPFKTLLPKKTWAVKTVKDLEDMASSFGGHLADWVEQAMEWAQRIANGEVWEAVCQQPDTNSWHRLVKWEDDIYWIVGGSLEETPRDPRACSTFGCGYSSDYCPYTVPLVVLY